MVNLKEIKLRYTESYGKEWVYSDTHFFHDAIFEKEPIRKKLGATVEEMNETIVELWNSVVNPGDRAYHLGDVAFKLGSFRDRIRNLIGRMNGYKILVMGNHDRHKKSAYFYELGFDEVYETPILWNNIWLSHEPILNTEIPNIHGHLHSDNHRSGDAPVNNLNLYFNASMEVLPGMLPQDLVYIAKSFKK